jgi:hypothetical protein
MRSLKYITLSFILLITSGCEEIVPGESFNCRVGETIRYGYNLEFTITGIADSRCPLDLICIWPGDVDLFLEIEEPVSADTVISLNSRNNPLEFGRYSISLINVSPYPEKASQPIRERDYDIEMVIDFI